MAEDREFCWRCHGYRRGMMLPYVCEDRRGCEKEMADTAKIEPRPKPLFDFSEFDADRRFTFYLIMGMVVAILLFTFALA